MLAPFSFMGGGIDPQALEHYDRVIADDGIIPAGLLGCNAWFVVVKAVYATTDITTAISAGYDPHYLGAKIGAGSGTTLGQAATKLYSCSGASGDLTQATAASMPLLLVKNSSDANYWFGSDVSGNYCSTPNAAANQITGDIDVIANIVYNNNGGSQFVVSKYEAVLTNHAYSIFIDSSNIINYYRTIGGSFGSSASTVGLGASYTGWIRFTRNAITGTCVFYTSPDGTTWTQLGSTVAGTTGSVNNSNSAVYIGSYANANGASLMKLFRVKISNTIGGTPVVDFNPASYNAATSQTQWTSTSGEVWTINTGTATTGYKGVLVDRTILQGDGVDDRIGSGTITSLSTWTNYLAFNPLVLSGSKYYLASNNADVNIIYYSPTTIRFGNNTPYAELNLSGVVANKLMIATGVSAGASSLALVNNANQVSGTIGTAALSSVKFFAESTNSILGNGIITTLVLSSTPDNSTQRTAMYNAIKSFNNSAF